MPLSAGRPHRHQTTSSRDAQLATAWQQHYHEPMILEKKRRAALRKKEPESLQQRREWPRSSRGDYWDDADDEGYSRSYDGDGMANGEYAG